MTDTDSTDGGATIGGTPPARQRPAHVAAPPHWSHEDHAPAPRHVPFIPRAEKGKPDPVRYGDWESGGIAVDF